MRLTLKAGTDHFGGSASRERFNLAARNKALAGVKTPATLPEGVTLTILDEGRVSRATS